MERVLTEKKLLSLRDRMYKHARYRGNKYPDEIAQEYVVRLLDGLHQHATVSQAYVDIVRLSANARSPHFKEQLALSGAASVYHDEDGTDHHITDLLPNPDPDMDIDEHIDFKHIINRVSDDRMVEIMKLRIDGEALKDIGTSYGLTESRISQLVQNEVDRLHKLVQPPEPPRTKRKIWRNEEPEAA